MKTVDDVLRRHAGSPLDAAVEIVRRFKGAALRPSAEAWCSACASSATSVCRVEGLDADAK